MGNTQNTQSHDVNFKSRSENSGVAKPPKPFKEMSKQEFLEYDASLGSSGVIGIR